MISAPQIGHTHIQLLQELANKVIKSLDAYKEVPEGLKNIQVRGYTTKDVSIDSVHIEGELSVPEGKTFAIIKMAVHLQMKKEGVLKYRVIHRRGHPNLDISFTGEFTYESAIPTASAENRYTRQRDKFRSRV